MIGPLSYAQAASRRSASTASPRGGGALRAARCVLGFGGLCFLSSLLGFCQPAPRTPGASGPDSTEVRDRMKEDAPGGAGLAGDPYATLRARMVEEQLQRRDIVDLRVLEVMARVPRHEFVPESQRRLAYADSPLPIGHDQTISQPYIVALMTQLVRPRPGGRALDIGTGSGYQAAVLAELTGEVYSIEIVCPLADEARERLARLGITNVEVRCGDGYRGWPQHAPFDAIILAAAPDHVPQPLVDQLAPGGHLVLPVGDRSQILIDLEKMADGSVIRREVIPVRFVPMTGESERR